MTPYILYRKQTEVDDEWLACRRANPGRSLRFRTQLPARALVVGRYSVLPNYEELEAELALTGSRLVNSYEQHKWIADLLPWGGESGVLAGLTPRSWPNWSHLPPDRSFVVKGRTNSKKQRWATHMFAKTAADIPTVAARLLEDPAIGDQGIVVREYVPLKQLGEGLNGLPITNEWRVFVLRSSTFAHVLAWGFYWKGSHPELDGAASFPREAADLVYEAARKVREHVAFVAIDVAETATGDWIVVEVNDGQMSGLNGMDPGHFYSVLHRTVEQAVWK